MAASQKTWYASFLKFLPKNNQDKKKKTSPSAKKSRVQIRNTLLITLLILFGLAIVENTLKDETPPATIQPEFNTKNRQIIEFIEAYNQNEKRKEEEKKCKYKFDLLTWILCPLADSKLLGQVQNIGVISAAILFLWDTFDRKKQLERQAWQLIDGAQGSETSGARRQAIEDLYEEGADITGLDADGADLRGINLSGANLTGASFKNAILKEANFVGANLRNSDFTGAKLQGADLRGANLIDADLTGANLRRLSRRDEKSDEEILIATKLQGAKLRRAKLNNAKLFHTEFGEYEQENTDLSNAYFRKANISFVDLSNVNLEGAFFGGAKTGEDELRIENIKYDNNNYQKAYYSQSFINSNSQEKFLLDKEYENQLQKDTKKLQDLTLLKNQDNIASLNLIELLTLLEYILVEYQDHDIQEKGDSSINVIISLKNKLTDLHNLRDSAQQEILLAQNQNIELDNQAKKDREELSSLKTYGEEIDKYIAQKKAEEEQKSQFDNK